MTSKTLQAWGAGCGFQLLLRLGIALVVMVGVFVCMLVVSLLPLPAGVDREMVAAFALIGGVVFLVVLTVAGAAGMIILRGQKLDAAFGPQGLAGHMLGLNGRRYHGTVNGRQVDAYFYRGPALDIYVGTPLPTRLAVGRRDRVGQLVAGLVNRQPLALDDAVLEPLVIYPHDAEWTLKLLNDARVRDLLLRLTDDQAPGAGRFELRQLHLQPEALILRLYRVNVNGITAEAVRAWLADLGALLRLMESAPPPTVTATATTLERTMRSNRGGLMGRTLLITFAALGIMFACMIMFSVLAVLVASAQ